MANKETIDLLLTIDSDIESAIQSKIEQVAESTISKIDSRVAYLIWRFMLKINGIKDSLLLLYREGDPYSTRILARSQIEHYFRMLYLSLRYLDDNETVAEEFLTYCDINEYVQYYRPLQKHDAVGSQRQTEAWNLLISKNPQLSGLDQGKCVEISKKFGVMEIVRFINTFAQGKNPPPGKTLFAEMVPSYAYLSSFVHGGAFAEKYYSSLRSQGQDINADDFVILYQSVKLACTAIEISFLFLARFDKSVLEQLDGIKKEISRLAVFQ